MTISSNTTTGQNGPGSNGNEDVRYPLQNWGLTITYSLASYSGHPFFWRSFTPMQ